jgi:membrane protease YdiL (CAAX protease family)
MRTLSNLRAFRPFFIVLACIWAALPAAAYFYSKQFPESPWITNTLLPALAVEACCYLATLFGQTRNWFAAFRPAKRQAAILWLSALIPYLIFSLSAGTFQRNAFYLLVGLTAVFSFWHAVLPRRVAYDFGFLAVAAAPVITRVFSRIYISPDRHVRADILGQLMWIRLGIAALLILRDWDPGSFGLWPTFAEWRKGFLYYCAAVIPVVLLALGLHDVRWEPLAGEWWRVAGIGVGTFLGFLWVKALSEELFFRGVIARALLDRMSSRVLAVILSAIVYGSAHLWFRGFPDWRRAVVTGLLGIFCGLAYAQTRSVKVPMITHTLVVTTWRLLFR